MWAIKITHETLLNQDRGAQITRPWTRDELMMLLRHELSKDNISDCVPPEEQHYETRLEQESIFYRCRSLINQLYGADFVQTFWWDDEVKQLYTHYTQKFLDDWRNAPKRQLTPKEYTALFQGKIPLDWFYYDYKDHDRMSKSSYNTMRWITPVVQEYIEDIQPDIVVDLRWWSLQDTIFDLRYTVRHKVHEIYSCDAAAGATQAIINNMSLVQWDKETLHTTFFPWSVENLQWQIPKDKKCFFLMRWCGFGNSNREENYALLNTIIDLMKPGEVCLIDYFVHYEGERYEKQSFSVSALHALFPKSTQRQKKETEGYQYRKNATIGLYDNPINKEFYKKCLLRQWVVSGSYDSLCIHVEYNEQTHDVEIDLPIKGKQFSFPTVWKKAYDLLCEQQNTKNPSISLSSHRFSKEEIADLCPVRDDIHFDTISVPKNPFIRCIKITKIN